MTLPPKLEKLLDNWPAKIISLVAAILVYAFYQVSTLETRFFVLPVEIKQDSGMVSTHVSETSVKISVRGNMTDITTLETKDFKAYVDMSRYVNEGTVVVPVQLDLSDNVRIMKDIEIKLQPETIEVALEKELAAYIPVQLSYAGGTAHGYEIESIKTYPSMIKVRGPESILDSVNELNTDVLLFEDLHVSSSYETELLPINSMLACEHEGPVKVEVTVVPSQLKRNYSNLQIKLIPAPENLMAEFVQVPVTCLVSGNELDVERFIPSDDFIYADCSRITEPGEYDIPLKTKNMYQVNVDSMEPESVHVVVTEKPEEIIAEPEE